MRQSQLAKVLGEPAIIGGDEDAPENVVKSAGRVFQILELLDVLAREALVCEISEALDLPQSSTSVLLRSMVELGYLSYNRRTRAYRTTTRVALLGHSLASPLAGDGALVRLVDRVNARTGQLTAISCTIRTCFQYILVQQARVPGRLFVVNGMKAPMSYSASGLVHLAQFSDAEVKRIALRVNAEQDERFRVPNISELLESVRNVREQQHALTNLAEGGTSVIALPLPHIEGGDQLALAIGGTRKYILAHREELLETAREEISRFAGALSGFLTAQLRFGACLPADVPSKDHDPSIG